MALRVLLADNSETIKKVMQLTLQDFAVDLRIVVQGVDVIDVAQKFKPDIIFIDILLQKKSGYEVAKEIKSHPQLKNTPVVLMWSGFMEFDEDKANQSLADARIEKPFDAKTLRDLVSKLVSKTKNNPLGNFLEFPKNPEYKPEPSMKDPLKDLQKIQQESQKFASELNPQDSTPMDFSVEIENDFKIESQEEFEMKPLKNSSPGNASSAPDFTLDLPEDISESGDFQMGEIEKIEDMSFLLNKDIPAPSTPKKQPPAPHTTPKSDMVQALEKTISQKKETALNQEKTSFSEKDVQKIVDQKVQEIVEKVVWQVVPELASQLIKKELERLLKENQSTP